MRILYDHQTFTGTRYGGVARYFYDLIRTLKNEPNIEVELALKFSNTEYLKDNFLGRYATYKSLPILGNKITNILFSHTNRINSAFDICTKSYDVFHPTFYNDYFLPFIGKKPFVVTYHDLIPELFSDKYAALDGFRKEQKQKLLNNATKIIAVSDNTKQDLLDVFKIPEDKIVVVHHATHFSTYQPQADFEIDAPKNYLLYVGTRDFYKNFEVFLTELAPLLKKYPDLVLLCAGSSKFNAAEVQIIEEKKISNQIQHRPIESDDMLYRLYQNAIAFVYPSLYEGFGIPIIEAFACGCPVILSDTSSFPEVAQNAALYFNPQNLDEMNHQIERILLDSVLRADLIQKGFERIKKFSLEKMAFETSQVYRSIG